MVENNKDALICAKEGAHICNLPTKLLGEKWNTGFVDARQYDPDFVLYVGSSDWVSDNYLDVMLPIAQDYEITGTLDFHLLHLEYLLKDEKKRPIKYQDKTHRFKDDYDLPLMRQNLVSRTVAHWKGYECERKGEPIGIGRLVSRDYLNRVDWMPFDPNLHKSLDYSMISKAKNFKAIMSGDAQSMAVSTNLWSNKHAFDGELIDDDYLTQWFPEAFNLF